MNRWAQPRPILMILLVTVLAVAGCGKPKEVKPDMALKAERLTRANGLPHDCVNDLAVFNGQVWVGTKEGIARWDSVNWQLHLRRNTNALGSDLVERLYVGGGAIWIATDNGVTRFDGNNWSSVYTGGRARDVAANNNNIAVATAHGIEYSAGGAFAPFDKNNHGLVFDEVNAVAFDGQGRLWVGTRAGMAQFSGSTFQNFTGPAKSVMGSSLIDVPPSPANCQLIGNNINRLVPYQGKLAVATTSGLSITDMGSSWVNYTAPHKEWIQRAGQILEEMQNGNSPMPGNNVTALAPAAEGKLLFVGTNKGLALLRDNTWVTLDKIWQGPKPIGITALAALNDTLWIGTADGLFRVDGILGLTAPEPAP